MQNALSRALPSSPPALSCSQPSSSSLCSSFLSQLSSFLSPRVLDVGVGRLGESSHVMVTRVTTQWQMLRKKWHETPDPYLQYPYPWARGRGIAGRGRSKPWRTPGLPVLFPSLVYVVTWNSPLPSVTSASTRSLGIHHQFIFSRGGI